MEELPNVLRSWSWEENKEFEVALAVVDEQHPHRWEVVAAMIGSGKKSAEDVHKHYVILLEDLQFIESGQLDHKVLASDHPHNFLHCNKYVRLLCSVIYYLSLFLIYFECFFLPPPIGLSLYFHFILLWLFLLKKKNKMKI